MGIRFITKHIKERESPSTKVEDKLYFEHGWPTFMRDHALENGEVLVFSYFDELKLNMKIFNRNSCSKEFVFATKHSQGPQEVEKYKKWKAMDSRMDAFPSHLIYMLSSHLRIHNQ